MEKVYAVSFYLLLMVGAVTAQTVKPPGRALPQWLTGIIAVAGFLFLAFLTVLVKKAWCDDSNRKSSSVPMNENSIEENPYDTTLNSMSYRKTDTKNGYDNQTFDRTDEKVTSM